MESLLGVVRCYSLPDSQISFVTRAVRIIDILTGFDAAEFNSNDGMAAIVERFVHETKQCGRDLSSSIMSVSRVCHQQRSALMKSLLNFLKRTVLDTNYAAQVRRSKYSKVERFWLYLAANLVIAFLFQSWRATCRMRSRTS